MIILPKSIIFFWVWILTTPFKSISQEILMISIFVMCSKMTNSNLQLHLSTAYELTHCGLVTPYGGRDLGQHWLRQWLVAWRHQANTWTNVDWSSVKSSDIHIRAISQAMPQPSITKICLKITYSKFHLNFPGANKLNLCLIHVLHTVSQLVSCHLSWSAESIAGLTRPLRFRLRVRLWLAGTWTAGDWNQYVHINNVQPPDRECASLAQNKQIALFCCCTLTPWGQVMHLCASKTNHHCLR